MYKILIENDSLVDVSDYGQYFLFAEKYGDPNKTFDRIITDAYDQEHIVWKEVYKADQIWLFTSFVGDSGRLMEKILSRALKVGVQNKIVVNINDWKDVCWHITDELRAMMKEATEYNNIQFIYPDTNSEQYLSLAKSLSQC